MLLLLAVLAFPGSLFTLSLAADPQGQAITVTPYAPRRVALVIGNAAYPGVAALRNPANDARDMAAKLRILGFDVIVRTDVRQKDMLRALTEFGDKVQSGTEALFYYAGHGMQVRGRNYLIPIDAEIRNEASVSSEAVDVDQLLDKLARARLSMVILDACRNNPFERAFRGGGQGLAQINAPTGTLIAYATAPGKVAADGDGRNGLYTSELLSAMDVPGIKIEDVFKRVRGNVVRKSGDAQTPWESSSLTGDFYFLPGQGGTTLPATSSGPPMNADSMEPATSAPAAGGQAARAPGSIVKDCADCPEMIVIPAGSFRMGSSNGESNERPEHSVSLESFAIGKTEVTQGQWKAVMGGNPSKFDDCGDDCPVERVNWNDAQEFVRRLSLKTGKPYRLPSEAEWEYACRAGDPGGYCGSQAVDEVAWHRGTSDGRTHPVARKKANAWGLYDMSGNVLEWTQDCWNADFGGAPLDGRAWIGGDCRLRVLRGGAWILNAQNAVATYRFWYTLPEVRYSYYGLRPARAVP